MNAKQANKTVIYEGKDTTKDFAPFISSITYTDNVTGKADTIELAFDDSSQIWQTTWRPAYGDKISLKIGFDTLVDCGLFEVDEYEFSSDPDAFVVRAISAPVKKSIRTAKSQAYENQTLANIVGQVARRNGLSVFGTIEAFKIERISQRKESDLKFLSRLATEYGYAFSVRGSTLVFENIYDLEGKSPVLSISRSDSVAFSVREKLTKVYKKSRTRYHNPENGQFVSAEQAGDGESEDSLEVWVKAETVKQAEVVSKSKLHKLNSMKTEGSIQLDGNPFILAGNNIEITGYGFLSGVYHIISSTHTLTDNGYTTAAEIKKVAEVSKQKQKPDSFLKTDFL